MKKIAKPIERSKLRLYIGKEYYIIKRKLKWLFSSNWAKPKEDINFTNIVFKHRSLILRPLKDVEMYLQENKRTNLILATKKIHKTVIKPGETFSLWKLVGRPSKRKGYLEGLVLKSGKIDTDTGGGLCQLGNLLFWVFAHSPLTITERYRHSYDVFPDVKRKVPFGAGATLSYNYIDLQVRNETNNSFQINLSLDDTHLNGNLTSLHSLNTSYSIEERDHKIELQFWGGYTRHNKIYQMQENSNGIINEKLLVENNAIMMYNPILEHQ
ncbi:VanW family protein [Tenacibaculum jejuense]|uniref:VanW family protein n=1 Tax=Tenacibaculum jejuense TaxID=584609 RepID=A0A238U6Z4_9FLAO|nr:VanW family protein [Tenacibaculum jejuense]SNR14927.1 VanW family protein [Tenacibaculum jejuense]